jgi:hypothetical protein
MTKKFAFLAAVFALLTITAPARAAYVYENIDLIFANGFEATGEITFAPFTDPSGHIVAYVPCCSFPALSGGGRNWIPFSLSGFDYTYISLLPYVPPPLPPGASPGHPGIGPHLQEDLLLCGGYLPEALNAFNLAGFDPAAPDRGYLSIVSPVPLPDALPLFGSAVFGLAGLAWRKRKVS